MALGVENGQFAILYKRLKKLDRIKKTSENVGKRRTKSEHFDADRGAGSEGGAVATTRIYESLRKAAKIRENQRKSETKIQSWIPFLGCVLPIAQADTVRGRETNQETLQALAMFCMTSSSITPSCRKDGT